MITGITKIKELGVFENYIKPNDIHNFVSKNLIYGWNYSGKTTLSRLFALLESKKLNPDLAGCSFTFETDGQAITEANYDQSNLTVRVFNSDFIKDNLHFGGESFKPILLLGKESDDAQKKINHFSQRLKKSQERLGVINNRIKEIEQTIAQSKTTTAKYIRQTLKIDPYTATHLNNDIEIIEKLDSQLLSTENLDNDLACAQTPDNLNPGTVDQLFISPPSIENLHEEALSVLASTPSLSNTIKYLEDNPNIERWVELGLSLHKGKEACEFCGSKLTENRVIELQAHFSKDLGNHKQKIADLFHRVQSASMTLTLPKAAEFNLQFRDQYKEASILLVKDLDTFNQAIETLCKDVQHKVDAPLKAMEPVQLAKNLGQNIINRVQTINRIIEKNNQLATNFTDAKLAAIQRIKYHCVQEFINTHTQSGYDRKVSRLIEWRERLQKFTQTKQDEIKQLQALISQAQSGREKINERLTLMLGSEAVQIIVIKDADGQERFQLVRKDGNAAKNLSDGERTAIAFSYFLTKLQEFKSNEFEEAIVYIDDPISSLDANHIFQVTAAIKEVFFCKKNINKNNTWTTSCKQFFLSTHNFQFFDLLRELDPQKPAQAQLYFLRKITPTQSILGNMPESLSKYSSEYHFLFETILKFRDTQDKATYDSLMLMPNAVRRFTELYTYSRIPTDIYGKVDHRAEQLFGAEPSKRILKILHYFSHANNIERFAGNNELIFDLEYAVNDLLNLIKKNDPIHWEALCKAIS